MSDVLAVWDVCGHELGMFDPEQAHLPLRGEMFRSRDPHHGWPAPFPASVDWRHMECPRCTLRPFNREDMITDSRGRTWPLVAEKPEPEPEQKEAPAVDALASRFKKEKVNGPAATKLRASTARR